MSAAALGLHFRRKGSISSPSLKFNEPPPSSRSVLSSSRLPLAHPTEIRGTAVKLPPNPQPPMCKEEPWPRFKRRPTSASQPKVAKGANRSGGCLNDQSVTRSPAAFSSLRASRGTPAPSVSRSSFTLRRVIDWSRQKEKCRGDSPSRKHLASTKSPTQNLPPTSTVFKVLPRARFRFFSRALLLP